MFYRKRVKNTLIVAIKNNSSMKNKTNSLLLCLLNSSIFPPTTLFLSATSKQSYHILCGTKFILTGSLSHTHNKC